MTFSRKRNRNCSSFKPEGHRFMKRIPDENPANHQLGISREFMSKIGNALSKSVYLKDPSGTFWRIELVKCNDGMVRFQKGWPDFADFYSLKKGDLVVFEYKGNSKFFVFIYKEIDYPPDPDVSIRSSQLRDSEEGMEDPDYLQFLAKFQEQQAEMSYSASRPDSDPEGGRTKKKITTSARRPQAGSGKASKISHAFKSDHPFFKVVMRKTNVTKPFQLVVPMIFSRKFLNNSRGRATLSFDGKVWPIGYSTYNINRKSKSLRKWYKFARGNNLRVGDVCIFELIDPVDVKLLVYIFRNG